MNKLTRHLTRGLALIVMVGLAPAARAQNLASGAQVTFAIVQEGAEPQFQPQVTFDKAGANTVAARAAFKVGQAPVVPFLVLNSSADGGTWTLNDKPIPTPLDGMRYRRIYQVPGSMLQAGENVLEAQWRVGVTKREDGTLTQPKLDFRTELRPQTEADLAIHTGPILGPAGTDFFTVTCRTTLPAAVTLKVGEKTYDSPAGYMHAFKVDGLKADTAYEYSLSAAVPETTYRVSVGPATAHTLPSGGVLRFAAAGDNRTNTHVWQRISQAIVRAKPQFMLHTGDMVTAGRNSQEWDEQFWGPARELCATVPVFPVPGNHEQSAPLLGKLFASPGEPGAWRQEIGPALFVGIDGEAVDGRWAADGPEAKWLDEALKGSTARFIFVMSHYPAWSSGWHGSDEAGQKVIFPLLEKYHVTAMIGGHDHCYERSEPGNGTTMVIAGGGGAPLYNEMKKEGNPHSAVYRKEFNYVLFTIEGDTCTMTAYNVDGQRIDERVWKAREESK